MAPVLERKCYILICCITSIVTIYLSSCLSQEPQIAKPIPLNNTPYIPASLELIDEFINVILQSNKGEDIIVFDNYHNYLVDLSISYYPTPITDENIRHIIQVFSNQREYSDKYFLQNLFSHYNNIAYNDKNYIFLFQDSLVGPITRGFKHNDKILLFIMLGVFDSYNNVVYIFVNTL